MKTQPIPEEIREKARQIADLRNKENIKLEHKTHWKDDTFNENWQGVLSEMLIAKRYPRFKHVGDWFEKGDFKMQTDFIVMGVGIEIKCKCFKRMYKYFFINVGNHSRKKHLYKVIICTGINNLPKTATKHYIFGLIETENVDSYPIEKINLSRGITSPAYSIPVYDIISLKESSDRSRDLQERIFGKVFKKQADARREFK